METRAHFILIGLFTILGIVGGLGFFLWLASVQIDRQYAQYGVLFDNVAGLNQSADVLFNGVGVGRVVGIRIWENNPSKVFVEIEIDATTPIAVDTMAQLASQGVTGVAYIALSGGSPGAAMLDPEEIGMLPIIPSRQSSFQSLVDSAPDLLGDASVLIKQLETISGPENQQALTQVLQNVEAATGNLDRILAEFAEILPTVRTAADDITAFAANLDKISDGTQATLSTVDATLESLADTLANASDKLDATGPAIANFDAAFASINALVADDISPLAGNIKDTLATTDDALTQMDDAFSAAQDLLNTDFDPVIADARTAMSAFADAMGVAQAEVPAVMSDLRATAADARTAIALTLPGLRDFGRLGGEARTLVRSISDLVRQLGSDPTGLLLDNRVPDYRR